METRPTYCRICEAACGLLADTENGEVLALRPDPDHVVSQGFVCAKGTRFTELHRSASRVDHPLERHEGRLRRTTWDTALGDVGAKLRAIRDRHGPNSIGLYIGNPTAFAYSMQVASLAFIQAIGTKNYFTAGSLDCNNKFAVSRQMLGSAATHPVPDIDHTNFALLLGTNPSVSQSSFVNAPRWIERLRAIEARGGTVVIVDPRRTETARSVGEHMAIVPDTDAALLLSLIHVVFEERLESGDFSRVNGLDELRAAARRFSPENVTGTTGISALRIRDLARRFARADGAFCHVSTGINQGTFGNIAYAAKIALELVTGNFDRAGGALYQKGITDIATMARLVGFDREPDWRSRIGNFAPVTGAMPTAILPDEILTPGEGQIRALIVVAGNPVLSAPDGARFAKALQQLELCVSIDMFVNDTAAYATHVLPATDFLEREDLPIVQFQLQPVPYAQWTDAVVEPRAERRNEARIFFDLARAAGLPLFGSRAADAAVRATVRLGGFKAMVLPSLIPGLGPRPLQRLRKNPHGVIVDREVRGSFLKKRIGTKSKRLELYPEPVWSRLDELESTLDASADSPTLRLISRRERLGHNSWMHSNPTLKTAAHAAHLSPADATRLGIARGDQLRISSKSGAIELPAEISENVTEGAVAIPHGYGHHKNSSWTSAIARGGVNVNQLAASGPDDLDPLSGMCQLIGIRVRIERIAATAAAE